MTRFDFSKQAHSIAEGIDQLAQDHRKFVERTSRHVEKIESELTDAQYPGLHLQSLLGPLCGTFDPNGVTWCPRSLFLAGSGPWDLDFLSQFLSDLGFEVVDEPGPAVGIVLGSRQLDDELLTTIAGLEQDEGLKLFPQELFVLGLVRDCDPYWLIVDEHVERIADDHSSIQFLLQSGVRWPTGPAWDGDADEIEDAESLLTGGRIDVSDYADYEWQSQSVLSKLGYSAKAGALSEIERRKVLDKAVSSDLRGLASTSELDRFGPPNHSRRLAALVFLLEWLNRFQSAEKPEAQEIRLQDMRWLQSKYDPSRSRFKWPAINAKRSAIYPTRTPNAAFMKALTPSAALAAIVGTNPLPRTEVVSKLWAYIKKNGLQDRDSKRMVNSDAKLEAVFGKKQVSMFEMAGLIGKHVR